ncbi:MAG TPA: HAD-IA family hydrolase, partial [Candidatus Binatia bacterium]
MIKAVFFDAAGTLMRTRARVGETYARIAAQYGKTVSPAELAERFRVCFAAAPRLAFPGMAEESICRLERDWWKNLVSEVFRPWAPFENFDAYFSELFDYFASYQAWVLYPEALEILLELKRRGLILGVISNFDSRLIGILAGLGVQPFFEHVFLSSRVGYAKPDAQIFYAALRQHGLKPAEALHVGDNEVCDLQGADQAGLRAVLIDRDHEVNVFSPQRIDNLKSILRLLDDRPPGHLT